jgi:nucleotide-binding universal stress UspA family protein
MLTILVTIDGSPLSLQVLPAVAKLSAKGAARVKLLTVIGPEAGTSTAQSNFEVSPGVGRGTEWPAVTRTRVPAASDPSWVERPDQAEDRVIEAKRLFLEEAATQLRQHAIPVEEEVVVGRNVAEAVIEFAQRENVDLIAMTTHGRSGLSELVQGSVAGAVLRSGVAPVLLVRPS